MTIHCEATLNRRVTDLARQLNLYLNHFPTHEKYGLCQQMRNCLYTMYALIVEGQKRYQKKTTLTNLDIEHEKLRWFVNLSMDLGYFDFYNGKRAEGGQHRFLVLSRMIDEIGRMIGGWIHSAKQDGS